MDKPTISAPNTILWCTITNLAGGRVLAVKLLHEYHDHRTTLKGRLANTNEFGKEAAIADFKKSPDLLFYCLCTIDGDIRSGKFSKDIFQYQKFFDYAEEGYCLTYKNSEGSKLYRQELDTRFQKVAN